MIPDLGGGEDPGLSGQIDRLIKLIKDSNTGKILSYLASIAIGLEIVYSISEHFDGLPTWLVVACVGVGTVLFMLTLFHSIQAFKSRRRLKRLSQITGTPKLGYFRLTPRNDGSAFDRSDGKHRDVLEWVQASTEMLLYLTGRSGVGKTSILQACVIPVLETPSLRTRVLMVRGYDDPLAGMRSALLKPGTIWRHPPQGAVPDVDLIVLACRHLEDQKLLLVFDQFEDLLILRNEYQEWLSFIQSLLQMKIPNFQILLSIRSDYLALASTSTALPHLTHGVNWLEVPAFWESDARRFLEASGIALDSYLLYEVLREASDLEETQGLIRPIVVNLCGLVLARFGAGLRPPFKRMPVSS